MPKIRTTRKQKVAATDVMFTSVRASIVVERMLLRDKATKVVVGIMLMTEIPNIVVLEKHA